MSGSLFSEFAPSSKKIWEQLAQKELKGKLHQLPDWELAPGVHIDPYLTAEELDVDQAAAIQHAQKKTTGWLNMPRIPWTDPGKTNATIRKALESGTDAVELDLSNTPLIRCEFPKLLHGLRLSDTPVFFQSAEDPVQLFSHISKHAGYYLKGGIAFDPIAHWMKTGKDFQPAVSNISNLLYQTRNMREFRAFMVQTHVYHQNGANPVQELAFALASTVTYMDLLTDQGIAPLLAFNRILFSVSVGTQYLTEIAKLRAFRLLLQKISRAYGLPDELCTPFLQACTSSFYHAASEPHTNIIRASSEAMSAVIGGCNALTVQAFDEHFGKPDDFSYRIARNVSSVLMYESSLNLVADPAAGSYLLENMSMNMADAAWELFLEIEEKGGLIRCFENGFVGSTLKKSLAQRTDALLHGQVMVGVNRFGQPGFTSAENLNAGSGLSEPFLKDHFLCEHYHTQSQSKNEA